MDRRSFVDIKAKAIQLFLRRSSAALSATWFIRRHMPSDPRSVTTRSKSFRRAALAGQCDCSRLCVASVLGFALPSIIIMNAKGGVGKSTLTMAIAETLAVYHNKRSLLIDADGQMSLSLMMVEGEKLAVNAGAGRSIVHLLSRGVLDGLATNWREYVLSAISDVDDANDLHLIQGDMDLPLLEREISGRARVPYLRSMVKAVLAEMNEHFDFVLVDCAPGISVMTETFLRECDCHIVPAKPDFLSFSGLEYLAQFKAREPGIRFASHLGTVINMQDMASREDQTISELLRERPEFWCFETAVPNISHLQKAALFSALERSYFSKYPSLAGQAMRGLVMEILQRTSALDREL